MEKPETLETAYDVPTQVETLTGFTGLSGQALADFVKKYGLAMDADDLKCCQDYFLSERPRPHADRNSHAGHLLVRPLPPHHLPDRNRPCRVRGRACAGCL